MVETPDQGAKSQTVPPEKGGEGEYSFLETLLQTEAQHTGSSLVHLSLWLPNGPEEDVSEDTVKTEALIISICFAAVRNHIDDQKYASL